MTPLGLHVPLSVVEFTAIRSQGPGGQNVNKVASAVQLRLVLSESTLPDAVQRRLVALGDRRITAGGVIVIKAQDHRSQERNRSEALTRLAELLDRAARAPKKRRPTKPTRASKERRLRSKKQRSDVKRLRRQPPE